MYVAMFSMCVALRLERNAIVFLRGRENDINTEEAGMEVEDEGRHSNLKNKEANGEKQGVSDEACARLR